MTMVLLAMFVAAGVGLFMKRLGPRELGLCVVIAVALAAILFFRPQTMT